MRHPDDPLMTFAEAQEYLHWLIHNSDVWEISPEEIAELEAFNADVNRQRREAVIQYRATFMARHPTCRETYRKTWKAKHWRSPKVREKGFRARNCSGETRAPRPASRAKGVK